MCMTGGFALALAVHPRVRAGVVAQPALPVSSVGRFLLPGRSRRSGDIGIGASTRQELRSRLIDDPGCLRANGYRFDGDRLSPPAKLASAADLLRGAFTLRTLTPVRAGEHSTLTGEGRDEDAVEEVSRFLRDRLTGE